MRRWPWLLPLALIAGGGAAAAEAPDDPLAPLRFLSGACWEAPFPDSDAADIMCVEPMAEGRFLRARHAVRRTDPLYGGETIYYVDGATRTLRYIYFTSTGGVSRGTAVAAADGLGFPDQEHVAADGSMTRIDAALVWVDAAHFRTITRWWRDGRWSDPATADYRKLPSDCASWYAVEVGCAGALAIPLIQS